MRFDTCEGAKLGLGNSTFHGTRDFCGEILGVMMELKKLDWLYSGFGALTADGKGTFDDHHDGMSIGHRTGSG